MFNLFWELDTWHSELDHLFTSRAERILPRGDHFYFAPKLGSYGASHERKSYQVIFFISPAGCKSATRVCLHCSIFSLWPASGMASNRSIQLLVLSFALMLQHFPLCPVKVVISNFLQVFGFLVVFLPRNLLCLLNSAWQDCWYCCFKKDGHVGQGCFRLLLKGKSQKISTVVFGQRGLAFRRVQLFLQLKELHLSKRRKMVLASCYTFFEQYCLIFSF